MQYRIILKPIISEKSELLSEKSGQYSFIVDKRASKLEIKKAIEDKFEDVEVEKVNTMIMPSKSKIRNTRKGVQQGRISSYKKAIVTLKEGSSIELFGEI